MHLRIRTSLLTLALLGLSVATASAERPRGTYIQVSPLDYEDPAVIFGGQTQIIYLNGCFPEACGLIRGAEDSRSNSSSIIGGASATIPAWPFGQAAWDQMVACVRDLYAPFGIEIVDEDPGNAPHWEAIVAGQPGDAGFPNGVGGVSPFTCGVIPNAITFTFAEALGGDPQFICEVVGQETAHAFGLDHEFLCEDPMTYLSGCGPKRFRDIDAQCGEFSARGCMCGGDTQNSFQSILSLFGESTPTPPAVTITQPQAGATVQPGFKVRADAVDNIAVDRVELYIDGELVGTDATAPYQFTAPDGLIEGGREIEVRAVDNAETPGSATVNVVLGPPCATDDSCGSTEVCLEGRCVVGPGEAGGLGEACTSPGECASGFCGNDGQAQVCAESCVTSCPCGFSCLSTGNGESVCWPGGNECGGCAVAPAGRQGGGSTPATPFLLGIALGGLFLLRRRRR